MNHQLFDETAQAFAHTADAQIAKGAYRRGQLFIAAVQQYVPARGRVLDYGCGPGRIARQIAQMGYSVLGLDVSEGMIAQAKQQDLSGLAIDFSVLHQTADDLPPNAFDGIVCSSVIEYVPDAAGLVQDWARALTRTGVLIMSFANRHSLWRMYAHWCHPDAPHFTLQHNIWTFADCRTILATNGLIVRQPPVYYDAAPFDTRRKLTFLTRSEWIGTLGLVVAQKRVNKTG